MLSGKLKRAITVLMLVGMSVSSVPAASGQEAGLDSALRANLAAIPLTADDLPDGYSLVGETFFTADQIATGELDAGQITDSGFVGMYASVYQVSGEPGSITSYVSVWNDADSAAAGFELLENEDVTAPEGGFSDATLEAGDGPAELTTGARETDDSTLVVSDATFVVDRYVVGVEAAAGSDADVSADNVPALVETAAVRATTVVDGGTPDGIELSLATSTLDITTLGNQIQAGFLSPSEAESLYGVSGSSLSGLLSSWISFVAAGDGGSAPYVVVGTSLFADEDTAARVVEQAADLVPAELELQPVDGFAANGADSVQGFTFTSPTTPDAEAANSFRAVAQSGDQVIVVDVQGADSVDTAQTAATELIEAQLDCGDSECPAPEISFGG